MIAVAAAASGLAETMVLGTSMSLFAVGVVGLLMRRSPVAVLMSVELMLSAGNLLLVLGSRVRNQAEGVGGALLVLVLGAAEVVVGLALALAYYRSRPDADVDSPSEVRG